MRHSDKVAAWEKSSSGARAALAEYRRQDIAKSLTPETIEDLIVRAYAPKPDEAGEPVWIPNHGLSRVRIAVADNYPKAQILDMLDELILAYERTHYSEHQ